jgi:hypothetical protein
MTTNLTYWIDDHTGQRLDRGTLATMWARAHALYEVNTHIFEDELEALSALGVVPMKDLQPALAA